jgi:ribosome biogenesis protein Nip4
MNEYKETCFSFHPGPTITEPVPNLTAVSWDFNSFLQYKVWIKPGAEQSFLYGNHVIKSGLGRITENTSQYQGVVVYSMADIPLVSGGGSYSKNQAPFHSR